MFILIRWKFFYQLLFWVPFWVHIISFLNFLKTSEEICLPWLKIKTNFCIHLSSFNIYLGIQSKLTELHHHLYPGELSLPGDALRPRLPVAQLPLRQTGRRHPVPAGSVALPEWILPEHGFDRIYLCFVFITIFIIICIPYYTSLGADFLPMFIIAVAQFWGPSLEPGAALPYSSRRNYS
jgi:hypothetical protein